ncbi:MAG: NUDIX domain-containing protein [Canibacter sp.]
MLTDEPTPLPVHRSHKLADGAVWDVREDTFAYGDETLTRQYLDHPGAVLVLALDEDDRALLIRQYRHPIAVKEWEIPGGLMDEPGESGLAGAQRELAEEANLAAEDWAVLLDTATTPGGSTELIRIFVARSLHETTTDFVRHGEEADMEYRWVTLEEIRDAAFRGDVQNGTLLHAVFAALDAKSRGWRDLRPADTPWPGRQYVRGERTLRS